MTLTQLRSFIAVVQHGGFTAAARALSTSQTTITSQIQTPRTGTWRRAVPSARAARRTVGGRPRIPADRAPHLQRRDRCRRAAARQRAQRGSLKIGAVGPFHVTEMIEAYHALHPHMHPSVALGNSETVLRDLDQYVCDVGVVARAFEDTRYFTQLREFSGDRVRADDASIREARRDHAARAGRRAAADARTGADHAPRARRRAGGCRPEAAHRDGHRQPRGAARGGRARSASARCRRPNTCRMHGCGRCASTAIRSRPISTCAA